MTKPARVGHRLQRLQPVAAEVPDAAIHLRIEHRERGHEDHELAARSEEAAQLGERGDIVVDVLDDVDRVDHVERCECRGGVGIGHRRESQLTEERAQRLVGLQAGDVVPELGDPLGDGAGAGSEVEHAGLGGDGPGGSGDDVAHVAGELHRTRHDLEVVDAGVCRPFFHRTATVVARLAAIVCPRAEHRGREAQEPTERACPRWDVVRMADRGVRNRRERAAVAASAVESGACRSATRSALRRL